MAPKCALGHIRGTTSRTRFGSLGDWEPIFARSCGLCRCQPAGVQGVNNPPGLTPCNGIKLTTLLVLREFVSLCSCRRSPTMLSSAVAATGIGLSAVRP